MDELPDTELEKASREGNLEGLQELVKHGVELSDAVGGACIAAELGHWTCVCYLVEKVDVAKKCGGELLQQAAVAGRLDVMTMLIEHGADLKAASSGILLSSAATCKLEVLHFALDAGADLNFAPAAAWAAAMASSWRALELLIVAGVDLSEGLGVQLLALAEVNQQNHLLALLKEKGVAVRPPEGELALMKICSAQQWGMCAQAVKYLVEAGVDLQTEGGREALVTAALCGDLEMVNCLIHHGCDVTGEAGSQALDRAGELGPPESAKLISDLLLEHGAVALSRPDLVLDADF